MSTKNGQVPIQAGAMRAQIESSQPSCLKTTKRVDHKAAPGIMRTASERISHRRWLARGNLAIPKPAQELMSSDRGTAMATTSSELRAYFPNGTKSKTRPKLRKLMVSVSKGRLRSSAVPGGFSAAKTIQIIGRRNRRAMASWTIEPSLILEYERFIRRPDIPLPCNQVDSYHDETG